MSELPPTSPPADEDARTPEPGSSPVPADAPTGPEFDTKDTQEIPVSGPQTRSNDGDSGAGGQSDPDTLTPQAAGADAAPEDLPAGPEDLRSLVLSRVRETREELLRLIDRFLEQQDRRARAEEEDRRRAEEQRQELLEREAAERQEQEEIAARSLAQSNELLGHDRDRVAELEGHLGLLSVMPDQVAALQSELVAAGIEIERLEAVSRELQAASEQALRVPVLETRVAAAERRVARSAATLAALRRAMVRIDEASSQTEVLARLLEEATGFASRSALFLVRRPQPLGELRLAAWGACGFSEQGAERIEVLAPVAWQAALDGRTLRGGAELGAPVALASDSEAPLDALIVPFILRDETRALLYVDRFDPDHPFDVDALQLLCFDAAHALEVLPLRHKRPAGTLQDPEWAGAADAPSVGAEDGAPAPGPGSSPVVTDATVTSPTGIPLAAMTAGLDTEPVAAKEHEREQDREVEDREVTEKRIEEPVEAGEERAVADAAGAVEHVPEAETPPAGHAQSETEGATELVSLETVDLGDSVAPLDAPVERTTQELDLRSFGVDAPTSEGLDDDAQAGSNEPAAPPPPPAPPGTSAPLSSFYSPSLFEGTAESTAVTPGRAALDSLLRPSSPVPPPPPADFWRPAVEPPPPPPPPAPSPSPAPPESVSAPPAPEPVPAGAADPAPAPVPAPPAPIGREVVPPSDIEGPGWAFAGSRRGGSDLDHAHEEAKRLARLLVSELQLYNEEEIDEGRRQGNVYRFLKEHIDKSLMLYEERVDDQIRQTTDYFREELVKSLAGGDASRLGF
ncbi:MAG TPA: GAF domain-containing protein [Thermoanaerobaculia bacterium]|nr:GAF domain-containing protein [Thermoanaerobaculia bacterium]